MKPHLKWACLILLVTLINGCTGIPSTVEPLLSPGVVQATVEAPTQETIPTSAILTPNPPDNPGVTPARDTKIPTLETTMAVTRAVSKPVKTAAFTPTPVTPNAAIQILAPGPASKVISPIRVSSFLKPGAKGRIRVDLLGEDGRLLGRKLLVYAPNLAAHMLTDMEFEIPGAAEAGRLVISTEDPQGRTMALASVDILLMSMGNEDINPPGDLLEDIIIQEPPKSTFIQGGKVIVSGLARLQSNEPLLVEMIAIDGQHIGPVRLISVRVSENGGFAPFTAEVPYSVSEPTWVRLMAYENPGRIPGTSHLSSIEILLGQ